jgi:hypothetical protein
VLEPCVLCKSIPHLSKANKKREHAPLRTPNRVPLAKDRSAMELTNLPATFPGVATVIVITIERSGGQRWFPRASRSPETSLQLFRHQIGRESYGLMTLGTLYVMKTGWALFSRLWIYILALIFMYRLPTVHSFHCCLLIKRAVKDQWARDITGSPPQFGNVPI